MICFLWVFVKHFPGRIDPVIDRSVFRKKYFFCSQCNVDQKFSVVVNGQVFVPPARFFNQCFSGNQTGGIKGISVETVLFNVVIHIRKIPEESGVFLFCIGYILAKCIVF